MQSCFINFCVTFNLPYMRCACNNAQLVCSAGKTMQIIEGFLPAVIYKVLYYTFLLFSILAGLETHFYCKYH